MKNKTCLVKLSFDDNQTNRVEKIFNKVSEAILENNNQGYKIVTVLPIKAGGTDFIQGIILVFEKIED